MNKKRYGFRLIIGMCAALGWWGLLYPELTLTPDTVAVHMEAGAGESPADRNAAAPSPEQGFGSSLYLELLNAGGDKVTFRSKLLTDLCNFWENLHDRNGNK